MVYEKPFGTSLESFRELDRVVHEVLDESQVFRIDHFLGKEATQELQALRFANGLFGGTWDRQHIEAVQIDVPETLDVADRAEFYDATGAVLDMLVTHLFQVAAEVAMEPPRRSGRTTCGRPDEEVRRVPAAAARRGGARAVRRLPRPRPHRRRLDHRDLRRRAALDRQRPLARGAVPAAHRQADGGERAEVNLVFRKPDDGPVDPDDLSTKGNVLCFDLAGDGALALSMNVKTPGPGTPCPTESRPRAQPGATWPRGRWRRTRRCSMTCCTGDRSLFTSSAGLAEALPRPSQPLLDSPPALETYDDDSWGPAAADRLTDGRAWQLNAVTPKGT